MLASELRLVAQRCVPGHGAVRMDRIKGGLVNETYRVQRDGAEFALRLAITHGADLGLDRAWEAKVLAAAAAEGLAPPVVYRDAAQGILLSRWVEGESFAPAELRRRSNLGMAAHLIGRIHALPMPSPRRAMSPGDWIRHYQSTLAGAPGKPHGYPELAEQSKQQLARLARSGQIESVLCHSDLHALNLLRGKSLVVLDWEYAHASEPYWDLAAWSCNNDFDAGLRRELLSIYSRKTPGGEQLLRLSLLCWLFDYVCLLWGELYLTLHAASPADGVVERVQTLESRLWATLG